MLFKNDTGGTSYALRIEILRTLGLLGALEPSRYCVIVDYLGHVDKVKKGELRDEFCTPSGVATGTAVPTKISAGAPGKMGASVAIVGVRAAGERKPSDHSQDTEHSAKAGAGDANGDRARDLDGPGSVLYGDETLSSVVQQGSASSLTGGELLKSDLLLDGDTADAPAYLTMYEQSVRSFVFFAMLRIICCSGATVL